MTGELPEFEFDAAPRRESCEKCWAGGDADLRFVIVRGRTRYFGRTLCEMCTEEVLEALLVAEPESGRSA